jgi:hypothetical protein
MNCNQTREAIDSSIRHAIYGDSVNAHLSGCPDCRRNADETESLLMLLKAQPRMEAPADFDFQLRARIARAKAEEFRSTGILERIWENFLAQTFSWGQAATAMAAVAVLITVSTFYIRQDNGEAVASNITDVAVVTPAPAPLKSTVELPPTVKPAAVETTRATSVRSTNRGVKATHAVFNPVATAEAASLKDIASADNTPRFYSRETRQVVQDRNAFGAEIISANAVKQAAPAVSF